MEKVFWVDLLLGLLLLLADTDAGQLEFVAGDAPLAVEVGARHFLLLLREREKRENDTRRTSASRET